MGNNLSNSGNPEAGGSEECPADGMSKAKIAAALRILAAREERRKKKTVTHARLSEENERDIVRNTTVRLAGFNDQGEPIDHKEDIQLYKRIESPLVDWVDAFQIAALRTDLPVDEYGYNELMYAAIRHFHEHGGHAGRFDDEHIDYMMTHGAIAFLELKIREGLKVTLGSVAALSSTPWTNADGSDGKPRDHNGLHELWPQYDLCDVSEPKDRQSETLAGAKTRMLICRSSIRRVLRREDVEEELQGEHLPDHLQGRNLLRIGLAARGKDELLLIGREFGSQCLTFNIGEVGIPKRPELNMANTPSAMHNGWMKPWAWRHLYRTPLNQTGSNMYWTAYNGTVEAGIEKFENPTTGLLSGKGWDIEKIHESARLHTEALRKSIEEGAHAPWINDNI